MSWFYNEFSERARVKAEKHLCKSVDTLTSWLCAILACTTAHQIDLDTVLRHTLHDDGRLWSEIWDWYSSHVESDKNRLARVIESLTPAQRIQAENFIDSLNGDEE